MDYMICYSSDADEIKISFEDILGFCWDNKPWTDEDGDVFTRALYEQKCDKCPAGSDCGNCEFNVSYEYYKEHGLSFLNLDFDA